VAGLLLLYVAPPVTCLVGLATGSAVAWLLMTASYLPPVRYARQPLVLALAPPVTPSGTCS
jgi:hypothetical protein